MKQNRGNVGIFSLFGKKDRQQDTSTDADSLRAKRETTKSRSDPGKGSPRSSSGKRDTHAARATALKIDAIESEMSSEFVATTTLTLANTLTGPITLPAAPPPAKKSRAASKQTGSKQRAPVQTTLSFMGTTTQMLLEGATTFGDVAVPASESAPVIEEAAILYASGQTELVQQMLRTAIDEDKLGSATQDAWGMLFDLYQITGRQQEFETLSIEYANKFETSPPTWAPGATPEVRQTVKEVSPIVPFVGKLGSNCIKQLERAQKLAENHQTLQLEFNRLTEVTPVGCGLLLKILNKLQKSGHDLILVGAPELATKIRSILQVGRRDETEAPWLLLLETLRLLNLAKEFEEVSIDYCVTFEVSPPAFVAPENKIITPTAEQAQTEKTSEAFMMPAQIEGQIDRLILAIAAYSDKHDPAIIDCSRLIRVDFNAAGRLLTGMAPFCVKGKVIEFHNINYLVAALFNVIGLNDIVRILPRKN